MSGLPIDQAVGKHRLSYRELNDAALPGALELSANVNWNQVGADWKVFLDHGTVYGLFEECGDLVATAAILPYPPEIAWISMVIVHPSRRRLGLATALVRQCLKHVDTTGLAAGLDASEAGATVYPSLGFVETDRISRMWRPALSAPGMVDSREAGECLEGTPLASIETLDNQWSGIPRGFLLQNLAGRDAGAVRWEPVDSEHPAAYLFSRRGRVATQIGPLGATNVRDAIHVLDKITGSRADVLYMDVPDRQETFLAHLQANGWERERGFVRMCRPAWAGHPFPDRIFAIAGPEFA